MLVAQDFNPSTQEERQTDLQILGQCGLLFGFQNSQNYRETLFQNTNKNL